MPLADEKWLPVRDFDGLYEVSNRGRVRSLRSGNFIAQWAGNSGYPSVSFWKENKAHVRSVHRLMAQVFLPNFDDPLQVNHIDGDKKNNVITNLEMVTPSENSLHRYHVLGFQNLAPMIGVENPNARPVDRFSLDGALLQHYPSQSDAVREGFRASCITECCKGTQKSHGGFLWAYTDAPVSAYNADPLGFARPKPVICIKPDGSSKRYESARAARSDGFNPVAIGHVLKGRNQTHKGYRWQFDDGNASQEGAHGRN